MKKIIKMAYYNKRDWDFLMESIDDPESMHDTWEEWLDAMLNLKRKFKLEGMTVIDEVVDIKELNAYCAIRGLKNNGATRADFVARKHNREA